MSVKHCLECGTRLPDVVTGGLCAACALRGALDQNDPIGPNHPRDPDETRDPDESPDSFAADALLPPPDDEPGERDPAPDRFPPGPGTRLGEYELLDEVARGGMGVVYRARQIPLDRVVAVKMLLPGLSSPDSLRRFHTEASAAAGLHHPHIVAIHDVGAWHGQPYLVMDYVEGASPARRIADAAAGSPDFAQAARWVKAIAEAVHYAHGRGILHRDLKPSNVLIDERGEPRVTDFGLAKRVDERSHLTLSGQALGSPSYMPPEQTGRGGGRVSRRSDIYGLGATLYHALTGQAPFMGETPTDVLHQVLTSEPVAPRAMDPAIPRDLETICLKCLEKDPGRRYASAQDVAEELGRFLDGHPIVARPVGTPERLWRWCRRKPLVAGLIAALAASLVTAGWLGWNARVSSQQLEQERMQRAIDAALAATWGGDRASAERAIAQAEQSGAPAEWVHMLNGQMALSSLHVDDAVTQFEQAVARAPNSVAARAMLASAYMSRGEFDRYASMLEQIGEVAPETPEDHLFLGWALIMGHADSLKAVTLLEVATQKRPSGMTFLLLGLAESWHALDVGSWPFAQRAIRHAEWGTEMLGPGHAELLPLLMNAYNSALRVCPEDQRAGVLAKAGRTARALESTASPPGHAQRAFYFQATGDVDAELAAWQQGAKHTRLGLFASWYAAAMLQRGRSAEALDVLTQPAPSPDAFATVARAYLLVDLGRPDEAATLYQQVSQTPGVRGAYAETILLLAGEHERVAANVARSLDAVAPGHPDYQVHRFWAGQASAEDLVNSAGPSRFAQCRAHYLIALSRLAAGDRAAARQHFSRSVETNVLAASDYYWSRAFLARLEEDPRWPAWIE